MHVYLREEPVRLEMREVDAEGIVPQDAELVPVAFFANGNERPSFRALLPPETIAVLEETLDIPVQLGLLAEEPESEDGEIHAMVGVSVPIRGDEELEDEEEGALGEESFDAEPWRASANFDGWQGEEEDEDDEEMPRAALLAFAPLVRLRRKFPLDFAQELADLLESALSGATRTALEARVDKMLGDL